MPPNQTDSLSRHLPKFPHEVVFGENAKGTAKAAVEQSEKRKARQLSVYIVSTNNDQLLRLGTLWTGVPCRLFKMDGNDFYTEDQGRYAGMGTDRLATLRGASELMGIQPSYSTAGRPQRTRRRTRGETSSVVASARALPSS